MVDWFFYFLFSDWKGRFRTPWIIINVSYIYKYINFKVHVDGTYIHKWNQISICFSKYRTDSLERSVLRAAGMSHLMKTGDLDLWFWRSVVLVFCAPCTDTDARPTQIADLLHVSCTTHWRSALTLSDKRPSVWLCWWCQQTHVILYLTSYPLLTWIPRGQLVCWTSPNRHAPLTWSFFNDWVSSCETAAAAEK